VHYQTRAYGLPPDLQQHTSNRRDSGSRSIFHLLAPHSLLIPPETEVDFPLGLRFPSEFCDQVDFAPLPILQMRPGIEIYPCTVGPSKDFINNYTLTINNDTIHEIKIFDCEPLVRLTIHSKGNQTPLKLSRRIRCKWWLSNRGESDYEITCMGIRMNTIL
jgi:hypothetical protein